MKFTTPSVAVGLFAASAAASQHVPQHFHQRRQYQAYNTSSPSTTLTVYATEVYTITSCAATVTDCPARASESTVEQVITSTVKAYTTVCPVSEASSASSALLSSYSAHDSSTAKGPVSTPYGTGVASPSAPYPTAGASETTPSGGASETTPSGPVGTGFTTKGEVVYPTASGAESVVLTYTLGSGTSTTVVTTTIKHTQTATVYATKPGSGSPEESGSSNAGVPTAGVPTYGAESATESGPTTTVTGTSTSTRYITVLPASSTYPASGASGTQGAAGSSGACVPVTVTVTQATATVTVTAPAYSTGANSGEVTPVPTAEGSYPTGSSSESSVGSEIVPISSATSAGVPLSTGAPYGNSSMTSTKSKCSSVYPSGYVSTKLPSGAAIPTGSYPASSATTSAAVATPTGSAPASCQEKYNECRTAEDANLSTCVAQFDACNSASSTVPVASSVSSGVVVPSYVPASSETTSAPVVASTSAPVVSSSAPASSTYTSAPVVSSSSAPAVIYSTATVVPVASTSSAAGYPVNAYPTY